MWTRGNLRRRHVAAPVPHVPWYPRAVQGAGEMRFAPPVPIPQMDPSDKRTWTRPVRWT